MGLVTRVVGMVECDGCEETIHDLEADTKSVIIEELRDDGWNITVITGGTNPGIMARCPKCRKKEK